MKKYYRVSFQYSETTYCTNIAKADNAEAVSDHYSRYAWHKVSEADAGDISEAERKGMPIIEI